MARKRQRTKNQNNLQQKQHIQKQPILPIVKTIGFLINRAAIFSDAEMGRKQGNKPDNFGKFKRKMCFAGIPAAILSSQAVANTIGGADEACCNAFIDNLKTYLPQRIVRPLFTARADPNSQELWALKPFFDELEILLKKHDEDVKRLSQYEMTAVAKEIGSFIRQDLRKVLINKHGLNPHEDDKNHQKSRPCTPNSKSSEAAHDDADDVVVLENDYDQEDEDDDVIFVSRDSQPGPSNEPIKVSCVVENLREVDLGRKNDVENEIGSKRRAAMNSQLTASFSPGYQVPHTSLIDFGKSGTSKNGPPSIWSQSRDNNSSRQEFVEDSDSSLEDEPETKKRRIIVAEEEKASSLVLNVSNSEDLDVSNDSENCEEISLIDEWNGEESDENVEEEHEEEEIDKVYGEDEYDEEEEEILTETLKNDEKRRSISNDKNKVKENFGVEIRELYDGESSLEKLEQRCKWPKNYERCLIGVVYNENLGNAVEHLVSEIAERSTNEVNKLSRETWEHYQKNTQSRTVYDKKMEARSKLLESIQKLFPEKKLLMHVTGSSINGCGSYNSDIDLCLCYPTSKFKGSNFEDFGGTRNESLKVLRRIERTMRRPPHRSELKKLVESCQLINAKVPIIKVDLQPPYADLDIDINVNNIAGIYNSHMLHYYSQIDGRFVSMALLIKHWAIRNDINDSMNGTLNSYSLILLVVHFLQCGVRPAVLPNLQHLFPDKFDRRLPLEELNLFGEIVDRLPVRPPNTWSVGELLIGFFNYYANFNFSTTAISVRSGQAFERSTLTRDTDFFQIFIEEPFDAINTARCVRRQSELMKIKKAFKFAASRFSLANFDLKDIKVTVQ